MRARRGWALLLRRNTVERAINRLKNARAVATRYGKRGWREQQIRWKAGRDPFTDEPDPYADMFPR